MLSPHPVLTWLNAAARACARFLLLSHTNWLCVNTHHPSSPLCWALRPPGSQALHVGCAQSVCEAVLVGGLYRGVVGACRQVAGNSLMFVLVSWQWWVSTTGELAWERFVACVIPQGCGWGEYIGSAPVRLHWAEWLLAARKLQGPLNHVSMYDVTVCLALRALRGSWGCTWQRCHIQNCCTATSFYYQNRVLVRTYSSIVSP
jgi:hypothetical protein